MIQKKISCHINIIFLIIFLIFLADNSPAEMKELSDIVLEKTIGAGLAISSTGEIGIEITGNISVGTGTGGTTGYVSLSGIALSECKVEFLFTVDTVTYNDPLKLEVLVGDGTDPCIPNGTGYFNVDLPTMSLKTGTFSVDFATDDDMSLTVTDKLFGLSYSEADISLYSGTIIVFPH